jgi:hypothetical protein
MKSKTSKKQTKYKTTEIFAAQERHASSSSSSSSSSVTFDTPQSTQDARETKPKTLLTEPYQQPSLSLSFVHRQDLESDSKLDMENNSRRRTRTRRETPKKVKKMRAYCRPLAD